MLYDFSNPQTVAEALNQAKSSTHMNFTVDRSPYRIVEVDEVNKAISYQDCNTSLPDISYDLELLEFHNLNLIKFYNNKLPPPAEDLSATILFLNGFVVMGINNGVQQFNPFSSTYIDNVRGIGRWA